MRPLRVRYVPGQRLFADAFTRRLAAEDDMVEAPERGSSGTAVDVAIVHACRRGGIDPDLAVPAGARVVVLSSAGAVPCAVAAARAGASAWLRRDATVDDLLAAVRGVAAGQGHYPRDVQTVVLSTLRTTPRGASGSGPLDRLTAREREVLHAMAQGHGNREVGEVLGMSYNTVRTHTNEIFRKLGVHNRVEAMGVLVTSG